MCLVACCNASNPFGEIQTVAGDPDRIQIRARCGPDTMMIRRPIHVMIRRSVLVRAVKTRRWFGSETASFHVSVCFCLFPYFPLSINTCVLIFIISCGYLLYFTSLITCITSWDIYDCSLYLRSRYELVSMSFHVLVVWHCWLGLVLIYHRPDLTLQLI